MAKLKVIIRVDGNSNIGLGHIYRGIALAEMLKNDFDVSFVTKQDSTVSPISEAGFSYTFLPLISYLDEPEWLKQNIDNSAIIICDGYEFRTEYQKNIKQKGFKLVCIDDLTAWHIYADVVINQDPGIKKEDYSAEQYTKFALGTDFAILRPVFLEAAKQKRQIKKIETVFICFGGVDMFNLTKKAAIALTKIEQIKKINIILGSANNNNFKINKINNKIIRIYKNLSEQNLLNVMINSDLAVVPASSLMMELIAAQTQVIIGFFVGNQKQSYIKFTNIYNLYGVGNINIISTEDLVTAIKQILKRPIYIPKIIDGDSGKRIKEILIGML